MRRLACRLFLLLLLPIAACAPTAPPITTSATPAQPQLSDADRAFLAQAASAESAELKAERAALAGTHNRAVQAYAQDTASQVSEELSRLQSLAASRQITLADATPPAPVAAPQNLPDPAPAPAPPAARTIHGRTAKKPLHQAPRPMAREATARQAAVRQGPALPRFADKDFLLARIAAQQATLALFRQEADGGSDPEVKQCAAQFAQRTEQHLRLAQEVARRL